MSRSRKSRNIRTLPSNTSEFLRHPPPEHVAEKDLPVNFSNEKLYFGEDISKTHKNLSEKSFNSSSNDSLDLLLKGIRNLGTSKSSSSSLSWGDECNRDDETVKVQNELELMHRVLNRQEPIPANYDREEYEEWMEFFPNLR